MYNGLNQFERAGKELGNWRWFPPHHLNLREPRSRLFAGKSWSESVLSGLSLRKWRCGRSYFTNFLRGQAGFGPAVLPAQSCSIRRGAVPLLAEIHGAKRAAGGDRAAGPLDARHPICRVFDWQRRLDEDKALTKVQIGEQEGLSKARMTQLFSLLHLPKDAQDYLANLTASALIKAFSVRQLMGVAKASTAERAKAFQRMRADCERRG